MSLLTGHLLSLSFCQFSILLLFSVLWEPFCVFIFLPYRNRSFSWWHWHFFSFVHSAVWHLIAIVQLMQAVASTASFPFSCLKLKDCMPENAIIYIINSCPRGLFCSWEHGYLFSPWIITVRMLCPLKQDEFPIRAAQEAGRNFFSHFVSLMTYFWTVSWLHTTWSFHYFIIYILIRVVHLLIGGV